MVGAYLKKVCRPEFEVRKPTWYCAIRRTRTARPERKMKNARIPVGPMGKTAQNTFAQSVSMSPDSRRSQENTIDCSLQECQLAKMTASTKAIPRRTAAVVEKRRWSAGCRKSLYGARLTGAMLTVKQHWLRAEEEKVVERGGVCFEKWVRQ